MRLLIVCQYYEPEPFRIGDIAQELYKLGHSVEVLTGIPNYPEGKFYNGYGLCKRRIELSHGVHILRVPLIPRGKGNAILLSLNYFSFMVCGTLKAMTFRKDRYDLVLVYQLSPVLMAIPGIVAAKKTKAPYVHYVVDLWPESLAVTGGIKNKHVYSLFGKIITWIYSNAQTILVTSQGFIKSVASRANLNSQITYIPQYPETIYRPVELARNDPVRDEIPKGFNVVFTGNIGVSQGLEILISVSKKLSEYDDVHWIIIGDGRARPNLETAVRKHGLEDKILFIGRRPIEKIPNYIAACDVALLCLRADPLFSITIPAKLQSYYACGIPVIGSIDGEASRIILESGAGLVGPAGDVDALFKNVVTMYKTSVEKRRTYALHAKHYHEKMFSKDLIVSKLQKSLVDTVDKFNENQHLNSLYR